MFAISKAAALCWLIQGGQLYRAYPFSKGSLREVINFIVFCRYERKTSWNLPNGTAWLA